MGYNEYSNESQKKYYEAQLQKKILYVPNLSIFLAELNSQILKLPHETEQAGLNNPIGTKYEDIVLSFCNGVEVVYSVLSPIRKVFERHYPKPEPVVGFNDALAKLAWIYDLLEDADMLNDHVKAMELPDVGEDYDDSLIADEDEEDKENEPTTNTMPTPEPKGDAKTLGEVEGEVQRPLAKESLAQSV